MARAGRRAAPTATPFVAVTDSGAAPPSSPGVRGLRPRATGRTLGLADALIAGAAYIDGAGLLTRNTRDFALTPVRLVTC
jgi:hypothetical protein